MNIEILNTNFEAIKIINEYESFIWTERYNTPGDFELYTPATPDLLKVIKRNYYVQIAGSRKLMIIEDIVYQSSSEDTGNHIKVTGRSLESILDRRIAYDLSGKVIMRGNLQTSIEVLFIENFINPNDPDRKIDNFEFHYNTADPEISELTVDATYDGESVLQIVEDLSNMYDLGWRINFVREPSPHFEFIFYNGKDKSSSGSGISNIVVFSPEYENVIQSTYTVAGSTYKTIMVVGGQFDYEIPDPEEEGSTITEQRPVYVTVGSGTGLNRREIFVRESGIDKPEGGTIDTYKESMKEFGKEELAKYRITKQFDGEYETRRIFVYGEDFNMGDIVEVLDEFGNRASARIVEYIRSSDISNGEESYPTFRTVDVNE